MAEEESNITLPEEVADGDAVRWEPIRELADAISQLYAEKKIFKFNSGEGSPDFGISTESTRVSDMHANVCTNDSTTAGCVYLTADITAPFRLKNLGKSSEDINLTPLALAFEFAYDPKHYKEYLNKSKLPVLITQYLLYYNTVSNDYKGSLDNAALTSEQLGEELSPDDFYGSITTQHLIESRRDKILKFWDKGAAYDSSGNPVVAGELYMIAEDPGGNNKCNIISRVAFAGHNGNGNGNSDAGGGRPADWISGTVSGAAGAGRFVASGADPWNMAAGVALTLTGVSWDRGYGEEPSRKGFKPETPNAEGYTPPPIGCCAEFIWPSIGLEGGGPAGSNNFYEPDMLKQFIRWADWRKKYQGELTDEELEQARKETTKTDVENYCPEGHFPCYLADDFTGDNANTYSYVRTTPNEKERYQRWVQVSETQLVRLAPMAFEVGNKTAYLTVPLTIVRIIKPKSYQTAIRKRWYDMMYYSLRNIAGYKLDTSAGPQVIGVTWNPEKVYEDGYLNDCTNTSTVADTSESDQESSDTCKYDTCKYERWKILDLGGEGWQESNNEISPFVGYGTLITDANTSATYNVAQTWQWDSERYSDLLEATQDPAYDLFPELYFEKLICYKNAETFNALSGGFELKEKKDSVCGCLSCDESIVLPWMGGGKNGTCAELSYSTHAYTFKKLRELTQFIIDNKSPENAPRDMSKMEIGEAHSFATAADKLGLSFSNAQSIASSLKQTVNSTGKTIFSIDCTNTNTTHTLPCVPAYYQTLSENESCQITYGNKITVETAKKDKSYGYNAYIWKAFDPGGYASFHTEDLTIKFTSKDFASIGGASTVINTKHEGFENVPAGGDSDPLYLRDTSSYKLKDGFVRYYSCNDCTANHDCDNYLYTSNKLKAPEAVNNNTSNESIWNEIIQWCAKDPIPTKNLGIDGTIIPYNYINPLHAGNMAMWSRGNEKTSIGTIDIYLAPVDDSNESDAAHKFKAKCLGSVTFTLKANNSTNLDPHECMVCLQTELCTLRTLKDEDTGRYWCSEPCFVDYDFDVGTQTIAKEDAALTLAAEATDMITVECAISDNTMTADITIPASMLYNKEKYPKANDHRQKYIILAARASHTNINSWLSAHNNTCDMNGNVRIKDWAMHYAGACRYAEFTTYYEFSRETSQ